MNITAMRWFALSMLLLAACKQQVEPTPDPAAGKAPVATAQSSKPAKTSTTKTVEFPTLRVDTLDGDSFDLAEQRGKWVVVNYWATWCGPCLKEMPELSALDAMREHVVVIGLAYEDTTADTMKAFMQEHPVVYPIAILDVYNPPQDFDTPRGLPMTYLITPEGKVARKYTGPVSARMLEEGIADAGGPTQG